MKDVLVMDNLDQIKCISQPYRLQIIESFNDAPATAKMISEILGEPHAKINYHIKEMVKHEILVLVEEVVRLGVVEKYYRPVAMRFVVHSASLQLGDKDVQDSLNQYRITIFDACHKAFYKAMEHSNSNQTMKISFNSECFLTKEEVETLQAKLRATIDEYSAIGETRREGSQGYTLVNMIIPEVK